MDRLLDLLPDMLEATGETLYLVALSMLFSGLLGLLIGLGLYLTRGGNLLANRPVYVVLNVLVNVFRPIPFIILIAAVQPLARYVVGSGIGANAAVFAISFAACFAVGRIVEQNLLSVSPGVIEAARAAGAGRLRIIGTVLVPEALGPLILGYAFVFIAVIDMSAVAGYVGGGGLGDFAIQYGYRQFNPWVTWSAVVVIVIIVQIVQLVANVLARRVLRR